MSDKTNASYYFYRPEAGHGLPADPFKAIVCPRPIGWISCRGRDGRANLAPYSFFNAVNDAPPMVAFASDGWKNSATIIAESGEFAVNFVSQDLAELMNQTSICHGLGISELETAGIASEPCTVIDVPRVASSPAVLECKLVQIVELNDIHSQKTNYKLVIGQVVGVQLANRFIEDGLFRTDRAMPLMRAGYRGNYVRVSTENFFPMTRPPGSY